MSTAFRAATAEPTRELRLSGPVEITAGDPVTASIDAQGRVTMGPQTVELARISPHPIVTLHPGAQGTIYAGTAGGGLLHITAGGKWRKLSDANKKVVSAVARRGNKIYFATNPKGALREIAKNGAEREWKKLKAEYIWALLTDRNGLIAATGKPGQVVKLTPKGKPQVLFDPGETHIRALIRHKTRGLIAGGGQKGIVYQIKGRSAHALYDSEMTEVTSFAADPRNGDLYAAFVSEKKAGTLIPLKWIGPVKGDPKEGDASPIKGSEVVRIRADGQVDLLWQSKREGALSLSFDKERRLLYIATGTKNKGRGRIYAVDTKDRDRLLLVSRLAPAIASSLILSPAGLIAGTGPVGLVNRIGPGLKSESIYVSKEQDLDHISQIGRVWCDADIPVGSKVALSLRSGNTKEHDKTWSDWSSPVYGNHGGAVNVPRGRYIQIRSKLRASSRGAAPVVKSLHASVVRINIAPIVSEVFLLRRGVYMASMPKEQEKEKTVTFNESTIKELREPVKEPKRLRVRQGIKPGMLTVSWKATDANKDILLYRVAFRRVQDKAFTVVSDDLEESFFTFDSRTYPDGRYQFQVTASDRPSNPPDQAMTDLNVSEPFTIDNGPPRIRNLRASATAKKLRIEAEAEDDVSSLGTADFSVSGGPWLMLPAKDGLIDGKREVLSIDVVPKDEPGGTQVETGRQTVIIRVEDEAGNSATASTVLVVK